jgi:hypothetical protein
MERKPPSKNKKKTNSERAKGKQNSASKEQGKKGRDKERFPGLKKHRFSRIKQEYHDIDYAHKLSEEEKEWLNSFMEEDLGARMNHTGPKLLAKDKEAQRESWRRNNSRNRDIYGQAKAQGRVLQLEPWFMEYVQDNEQERLGLVDNEALMNELLDLTEEAILDALLETELDPKKK